MTHTTLTSSRFLPLDQLRGLLIVIMGLDHAVGLSMGRSSTELWSRAQPATDELGTFFVRYISHPAATGFLLVMGIAFWHSRQNRMGKGQSEGRVTSHSLMRGLLLLFLQFTLINFAWLYGEPRPANLDIWRQALDMMSPYRQYYGVVFAAGCGLIVMACLAKLQSKILTAIVAVILLSPVFYLSFNPSQSTLWWIVGPLGVPGRWDRAWVLYTVIPWAGICLGGLLMGRMLEIDREKFLRFCLVAGGISIGVFLSSIAYRAITAPALDVIPIMYLVRYPPELLLLAMAFGLSCLAIKGFSMLPRSVLLRPLELFGRVSLFFYTTHLFVYGFMAIQIDHKASLGQALMIWVLGLLVMLPLCWSYLKLLKPLRRLSGRIEERIVAARSSDGA